ncbi:MAG: GMC family oxidoreductase, partial [Betaproteobacteria bacterium]|nr:GMC family oxidoreductase [Betaproteobacteria bacterium]
MPRRKKSLVTSTCDGEKRPSIGRSLPVYVSSVPENAEFDFVIGGCGSINGNLFVRGDPAEYDSWRAQGCRGWGYSDLLPYFRRLEDY